MKQVEVASTSIKTEYFGSLTERTIFQLVIRCYRQDYLGI